MYFRATCHSQEYKNIDCCTTVLCGEFMSPTKLTRRLLSSSCIKCPIFLSYFNQFDVSRQIFIEVLNVKFHGNPTSGNRDDTWPTDRETEGWATLRKLTGALRDYVQLDNKHWYVHVPKSVATIHKCGVTIIWNLQVRTDRTVPNNKPDIIIRVIINMEHAQ